MDLTSVATPLLVKNHAEAMPAPRRLALSGLGALGPLGYGGDMRRGVSGFGHMSSGLFFFGFHSELSDFHTHLNVDGLRLYGGCLRGETWRTGCRDKDPLKDPLCSQCVARRGDLAELAMFDPGAVVVEARPCVVCCCYQRFLPWSQLPQWPSGPFFCFLGGRVPLESTNQNMDDIFSPWRLGIIV